MSRGCEALAGPTLPSGPHSSWVGGRATRPRQPQDASQLCDFPSKRSRSSPQGPHPFPLHKCSLNPYNTLPVIPPGPAKPRPAHQRLTGTGSLPGTCCLACYRIIRSSSSSLIFNVQGGIPLQFLAAKLRSLGPPSHTGRSVFSAAPKPSPELLHPEDSLGEPALLSPSGPRPTGEALPPASSWVMPGDAAGTPEVKRPARRPQGPESLGWPGTPDVPSLAWRAASWAAGSPVCFGPQVLCVLFPPTSSC